jgi:hypothetical protein
LFDIEQRNDLRTATQAPRKTSAIQRKMKNKQAQKRPKVFGWAQIISLLNIEQSCIWLAQI